MKSKRKSISSPITSGTKNVSYIQSRERLGQHRVYQYYMYDLHIISLGLRQFRLL